MNRRQILTTTGAVASLSLCAGIVAGVPGCTPAPAAEPISAGLAFAIQRHRTVLAEFTASCMLYSTCEDAVRTLRIPETVAAMDAADEAAQLDGDREMEARLRFLAEPIVTVADMRAKAQYIAENAKALDYGEQMAALVSSMGATSGIVSDLPAEPDPLAALAADYRDGLATYNATGNQSSEGDEALADQLWRPSYRTLCAGAPAATTLAGALAGIRLVLWEEETCGHHESFTINTLRAALAYFDGRA